MLAWNIFDQYLRSPFGEPLAWIIQDMHSYPSLEDI